MPGLRFPRSPSSPHAGRRRRERALTGLGSAHRTPDPHVTWDDGKGRMAS